jgi:hypothetical protein
MSDQEQKSSSSDSSASNSGGSSSSSSWRTRIIVITIVLFIGAFIGRWIHEDRSLGKKVEDGANATATTVGAKETFEQKINKVLPYITEACLALIIAMMAGILMKSALKFAGILLVVGFIGLQVAMWKGWLPDSIDFSEKLNDLVFVEPTGNKTEIAISKAPSAGAGVMGLMMGLSKG